MDNDNRNPNPCPVCSASPFERCRSNGFPGEVLPHSMRSSSYLAANKLGTELAKKGLAKKEPKKTSIAKVSDDPTFDDIIGGAPFNDIIGGAPFDDIIGGAPFDRGRSIATVRHINLLKKEWTAHGLNSIGSVTSEGRHRAQFLPQIPFKAHYLIVTTPGFFINELAFGNCSVLENVPADAYLTQRWDKLERIGALDRVRIRGPALNPGVAVRISFSYEIESGSSPFRAALIGEELA